ncbi:hypothetical protein B7463_g3511, partial [Scytalidium lignicola]
MNPGIIPTLPIEGKLPTSSALLEMLSLRCKERNETLIPSLLSQHDAVLAGDVDTIDLSTAENWSVKDSLLNRLQDTLDSLSDEDLAYSSGIGGCLKTRKLMSELLNHNFRPVESVTASHIVLAAGGSFALTALMEQICDPGDGILIATPYWAGLDISISIHCHARIIPVNVPLDKFFCSESIQYYESSLDNASIPIKAILICNPHNPLGQCYPRETIQAMQDFCKRKQLHYISDEVYALSLHQPAPGGFVPFVSALEIKSKEISDQVHIIYSLSKDFGCSGIRLGALITQSNNAVRLSAALSVHSQVSTLSTSLATKKILTPDTVRQISEKRGQKLNEAYQVIRSFLEKHNMEFIPVSYGMFVFARVCKISDIDAEQKLLGCLKARGVSVSTGTSYHFQEPGWFRICYGVPLDQLHEGLKRLECGVQDYLYNGT